MVLWRFASSFVIVGSSDRKAAHRSTMQRTRNNVNSYSVGQDGCGLVIAMLCS